MRSTCPPMTRASDELLLIDSPFYTGPHLAIINNSTIYKFIFGIIYNWIPNTLWFSQIRPYIPVSIIRCTLIKILWWLYRKIKLCIDLYLLFIGDFGVRSVFGQVERDWTVDVNRFFGQSDATLFVVVSVSFSNYWGDYKTGLYANSIIKQWNIGKK